MDNVVAFPVNPELTALQIAELKTLDTLAAIAETYAVTLETTLKDRPLMYTTTEDLFLMGIIEAELQFALDDLRERRRMEDELK